ncbi:MAG: metallophosphoesterase [Flammeovirgaceae bacterium TMED290]|nr:MAG: metallophosphoesterase [Flammeovirgaceae bacterium TMED290]|tara:strand:- start:1693 stop:2178 length:486 start_codon:yes stop_codon:yes gene_type:complete
MKIGIISDTHNFLPDTAERYLKKCDEIWHAGDIGSLDLLNKIKNISFTRAVSGNIDGEIVRSEVNEFEFFKIKNIKILIIHIAGKIKVYNAKTRNLIRKNKPDILVCGHSHILKVANDEKFNLLYINPGAAGKVGFQREKTMIIFNIKKRIEDMQVIKLYK